MRDQQKTSQSQDTLVKRAKDLILGAGRYDHISIMVLAAICGVLVGYMAIGFYIGIDFLYQFLYGFNETDLASGVKTLPWWHVLSVLIVAGLIVGQLLRFLPDHLTQGVPHVIEASSLHDSNMSIRHGIISAAATLISLGAGASAGREGPVVHFGATLSSTITQLFGLSPAVARTLLGCGVASAVAASFNAPIAGVFFALEVVIGHYALHTFTPVVIAAIAGTLVSRAHFGDFPAFQLTDIAITSFWEFPAFMLLGVVSAFIAIIFMAGLNYGDKIRSRFTRIPYWVHPALGGVGISIIAFKYPEVLSVGYEATSNALNGYYELKFMVILIVAKTAATIISIASRFGGGVFSPSLFLGAMVGGTFGIIAANVFPEMASSHNVYAIVGMGALASAVMGAPISTMLIVFEITGEYSTTIAVMIASAVATMIANVFHGRSFFHMQLATRGIRLEQGRASYLLKSATVSSHMSRDFFTIHSDDTLMHARELLVAQGGGLLITTDGAGKMTGTLSLNDLPTDIFDDERAASMTTGEICHDMPLTVKTTDLLQVALTRMEQSGEDILPVVAADDEQTVIGLIYHRAVMQEYNRALLENQGQHNQSKQS